MSAMGLIQRTLALRGVWCSAPVVTSRLLTAAPSAPAAAVADLHTGRPAQMPYTPPTGPRRWPELNKKVFPPTAPDEPPRPAYVCHVKKNVKYSQKKMWYIASMIRGMSIGEALKQLVFVNKKGAKIITEALLEAQQMAVTEHNVEYKNNLWVAESYATKAQVIKGIRRHARMRMGVVHYRYIHYFVRLEEGPPPKQYYVDAAPSPEDMLKQWLENRRQRTIIHTL